MPLPEAIIVKEARKNSMLGTSGIKARAPTSEKNIDPEPKFLIHDPSKEKPQETKILARTLDLYLESEEKIEYKEYKEKIKKQIRKIIDELTDQQKDNLPGAET
jgi:hypothetical protein